MSDKANHFNNKDGIYSKVGKRTFLSDEELKQSAREVLSKYKNTGHLLVVEDCIERIGNNQVSCGQGRKRLTGQINLKESILLKIKSE